MAKLTQEQYNTLRAKGLSDETIKIMAEKKGYALPDDKDFLEKAGTFINKIFPGGKIGENIGTTAAKYGLTGLTQEQRKYVAPGPTTEQLAGDILGAGTMIAAAGMPVVGGIAGKAAQFGTIGALGGASKELTAGEELKEVAKGAIVGGLVGAGTGATFGVVEKGFKALGGLLGKTGEKIQTAVIKPTQADIKDGFSIQTVNKYNLGGSLKKTFEKTDTTLDDLSKNLTAKLAENKTPVDLNKVYENTAKRLLGNKFESFGANTQMDSAIEKLRGEIVSVASENGLVSIPEAQIVKRASGHFGAWVYGIPTPEATASQKVYNIFYNELKTAIEKASPEGIKGINKQISELIPVMNALIRRIPVAERSATFSLTDIITMTGAVFEPRALGLTLLNLASKSGTIGAKLAKVGPKAGEALSRTLEKAEPIGRVLIR